MILSIVIINELVFQIEFIAEIFTASFVAYNKIDR